MKKTLIMSLFLYLFSINTLLESSPYIPTDSFQKNLIDGISKYPQAVSIIAGLAGVMAYQNFIGKTEQDTLFIGWLHDDETTKCGIGLPGVFIGFQQNRCTTDFLKFDQNEKAKDISKNDSNALIFGAITAGLTYMFISSIDKK